MLKKDKIKTKTWFSLTVWNHGPVLALQSERGPEARAVVKAPALLDLGGAATHQFAPAYRVISGGTPLAVVDGGLSALHALTARTGHPDPLLKTQLLTGRTGRRWGGDVMKERDKGRGREEYMSKIFFRSDIEICPLPQTRHHLSSWHAQKTPEKKNKGQTPRQGSKSKCAAPTSLPDLLISQTKRQFIYTLHINSKYIHIYIFLKI